MTVYLKRKEGDEWEDAHFIDLLDGTWPDEVWVKLETDDREEQPRSRELREAEVALIAAAEAWCWNETPETAAALRNARAAWQSASGLAKLEARTALRNKEQT